MRNTTLEYGPDKDQELVLPTLQRLREMHLELDNKRRTIMRALSILHHTVMIDLVIHSPSKYVDIECKEIQSTDNIEQIERLLGELKTDIGKIIADFLFGLEPAVSGQQKDSRNYVEGLVQVMQEMHKILQDEFDSLKENFEVGKGNWSELRLEYIKHYSIEYVVSEEII
jgi:hypothetical protein